MRLLWMLALPGCLWVGKEDHDDVVDGICQTSPDDPACPEVTPTPVPTPPPTPPPTVVMVTCYPDADGDGYGAGAPVEREACDSGFAEDDTDCDDGAEDVFPGAEEICGDGIDQDCDEADSPGITAFEDGDGDLYGGDVEVVVCALGPGVAALGGDCNDADASVFPLAAEVAADGVDQNCDGFEACPADEDGDSFTGGALVPGPLSCTASSEPDCADNDPNIFPGASELIADGVDSDCDGMELCYLDADHDDFGVESLVESPDLDCLEDDAAPNADDCNDGDFDINPDAEEICTDDIDHDCSGDPGAGTWYEDADGDGFGDPGSLEETCDGPAGFINVGGDCNDDDDTVNPNAPEVTADGVDSDCDGFEQCYSDADGDGFGADLVQGSLLCDGEGESTAPGDCDEACPSCFPGADEVCDGLDNSCDGVVDTDAIDQGTYYLDTDGDSWGAGAAIVTCNPTADLVEIDGDCAPDDDAINPGAEEVCANGVDDNCNPADDGVGAQYWPDDDADGFGAGTAITECSQPPGHVTNDDDCDDTADTVFPGADPQVGDGIDQDCDGVDECYHDEDGDGFGADGAPIVPSDPTTVCAIELGDCNDLVTARNPNAIEQPGNNIDENCDDLRACYVDDDNDTYGSDTVVEVASCVTGYSINATDCDDSSQDFHPGAPEICDGEDNNCDGTVHTVEIDDDGDGFVDCPNWMGIATLQGGDCDDGRPAVNPGATEYCEGDDTDCNGFEEPGLVSSGTQNFSSLEDAVNAGVGDIHVCGGPGTLGEHPVKLDYPGINVIRGVTVAGTRPRLVRVTPFDRILREDNGITFENLIIDGGGARLPEAGGCLRMDDSSLSLMDVVIRNCETDEEGGAIFMEGGATLSATNVMFESNVALGRGGGAVMCANCESVTLSNVIFEFNGALGGTGGAMLVDNANGLNFQDGSVHDNLALDGGGIFVENTSTTLAGLDLFDNVAHADGGALFTDSSQVVVDDCMFTANTAVDRGQAIHVDGGGPVDLIESSVFANGGPTDSAAGIRMVGSPSVFMDQSEVSDQSFGLRMSSGSLESSDAFWNVLPDNGVDIQTVDVLGFARSFDDPPDGTFFFCDSNGCSF